MLQKLISGIIVAVLSGAIGRGIVIYFDLGNKAARMMQVAASSPAVTAVGWGIAGIFGLIGIASWLLFHVDERLYDALVKRPELGSLQYVNFVARVERFVVAGRTHVELVADIQNTNDFLVRFRATLRGEVNGKAFVTSDGQQTLSFDGYANPNRPTSLILRIPDVPTPPVEAGAPSIHGTFEYDVTYFAAPAGRRTRTTFKQISFETRIPLGQPGDAPPGTSRHTEEPIRVLFLQQREE